MPLREIDLRVPWQRVDWEVPVLLRDTALALAEITRRGRHGRNKVRNQESHFHVLRRHGSNRRSSLGNAASALLPFLKWRLVHPYRPAPGPNKYPRCVA